GGGPFRRRISAPFLQKISAVQGRCFYAHEQFTLFGRGFFRLACIKPFCLLVYKYRLHRPFTPYQGRIPSHSSCSQMSDSFAKRRMGTLFTLRIRKIMRRARHSFRRFRENTVSYPPCLYTFQRIAATHRCSERWSRYKRWML